jgi:hypothetical protein
VGAFCKPYAPFAPIGALHLAGPAKRTSYRIRRTGGGAFETFLGYGASPEQPAAALLPADKTAADPAIGWSPARRKAG